MRGRTAYRLAGKRGGRAPDPGGAGSPCRGLGRSLSVGDCGQLRADAASVVGNPSRSRAGRRGTADGAAGQRRRLGHRRVGQGAAFLQRRLRVCHRSRPAASRCCGVWSASSAVAACTRATPQQSRRVRPGAGWRSRRTAPGYWWIAPGGASAAAARPASPRVPLAGLAVLRPPHCRRSRPGARRAPGWPGQPH